MAENEASARPSALVLFSGGQDSTTALAWSLGRYLRVETVGFDYGQRHRVELDCRAGVRQGLAALDEDWQRRLGPDHVLDLTALGTISSSALTGNGKMTTQASGPPTSFVAGRNPIFLTVAAALAAERGLDCLVAGMCRNDAADYPDCRPDSIAAVEKALALCLGRTMPVITPFLHGDKAGTWQMAQDAGGAALIDLIVEHTHSCYLGDRNARHDWGYGCGDCLSCRERAAGWRGWRAG